MKPILFALILLPLQLVSALSPAEKILQEKRRDLKIGVIYAHPKEGQALTEAMESPVITKRAGRTFHQGRLWGFETVVAGARMGKVAAATTATTLILEHNVDLLLLVGVAGGLDPALHIGDIVIGDSLIQHDLDSSPLCPRYVIPLLGIDSLKPDPYLIDLAYKSSSRFLNNTWAHKVDLDFFHQGLPTLKTGMILTGDQFISERKTQSALISEFASACCVEMEGAAMAQVAHEHNIPFVVIRVLSDGASNGAAQNCLYFMNTYAGIYAVGILEGVFQSFQAATGS